MGGALVACQAFEEGGVWNLGAPGCSGGEFGAMGRGEAVRASFALLNLLGSPRGKPEMTPALLPWQSWGLDKVVSIHHLGPTGAGVLPGSQNYTRDSHCLS